MSSGDSAEFIFDFPQPSEEGGEDSYFQNPCEHNPNVKSLVNSSLLVSSGPRLTAWLFSENLFTRWTPLHHVYFQLANFFLLVYFLFFFMTKNEIVGRLVCICYSVCMVLWGYFVIQSMDLLAWNSALILVNLGAILVRLISIGCGKGYGLCRKSFSRELEQVYRKLFEPLHVNRRQFARILSCKRNTRQLHPGEHYSMEKSSRVDSLALLLSGRLLVSQQGRPLHIILPHQFVDSPEYFGVSTDELFQVTITAVEDSKVLVWHRDKLRLTIMSDEFLRVMFDHIIGRDVVRKLIQVSDSVSMTNGYYLPNSTKDVLNHHNETNNHYTTTAENEPMLSQIQTVDENGVETNFETNCNEIWSLTKIAEEETPV